MEDIDLLIGEGRNERGVQELVLLALDGCCAVIGFLLELLPAVA